MNTDCKPKNNIIFIIVKSGISFFVNIFYAFLVNQFLSRGTQDFAFGESNFKNWVGGGEHAPRAP